MKAWSPMMTESMDSEQQRLGALAEEQSPVLTESSLHSDDGLSRTALRDRHMWLQVGGKAFIQRDQLRNSLVAITAPPELQLGARRPRTDAIGGAMEAMVAAAAPVATSSDSRGRKNVGTSLWVWGGSNCGQLGLVNGSGAKERKSKNLSVPTRLDFPKGINVCSVSCGGFHTLALTESGDLLSWGDGKYGQLGYKVQGFGMQARTRTHTRPCLCARAPQSASRLLR